MRNEYSDRSGIVFLRYKIERVNIIARKIVCTNDDFDFEII